MSTLAKKSEKDLLKMLQEKREALRVFRFGSAGSKSKDVKAAQKLRKEVARILTALHERKTQA